MRRHSYVIRYFNKADHDYVGSCEVNTIAESKDVIRLDKADYLKKYQVKVTAEIEKVSW